MDASPLLIGPVGVWWSQTLNISGVVKTKGPFQRDYPARVCVRVYVHVCADEDGGLKNGCSL